MKKPVNFICFISKRAHGILAHAQLLDCKPTMTPIVVLQQLYSDDDAFTDPTLFRSMVGDLQYLTITCPDLTYVVNSISQYIQSPMVPHF
jgi:hypothetical protein